MRIDSLLKGAVAVHRAAPELRKLDDAARQMEAGFMKQMLATMRRGMPETHFGQQFGGDIFRDMMDDALAQAATGSDGRGGHGKGGANLGIADQIRRATSDVLLRQELQRISHESSRPTTPTSNKSNS